ncbi:hypothetical protein [Nostoc sp. MG11]|nr:hypothetical protein [Nostoc sp. MG11]
MSQTLKHSIAHPQNNPLHSLKEWEEDLLNRYLEPDNIVKESKAIAESRN